MCTGYKYKLCGVVITFAYHIFNYYTDLRCFSVHGR